MHSEIVEAMADLIETRYFFPGVAERISYWPTPHFSLLLPEAVSVNSMTGTNWEGCGAVPDDPCSGDKALRRAVELAGIASKA